MRGKLLKVLENVNSSQDRIDNILTPEEEHLCSFLDISTKYAYLLGNDRTFFNQLPICWRCNCTKKLNKVSLLEQIPLTPFHPNHEIELFNIFKLKHYQHIFDLLHCDARTLEHMLNNTCMNDDRLLDFLVEILPKLVKKHCGQTIHLKLSTTKDTKNTGDSTDQEII
ncbi:predicted protein [Naegleria gruberi]|uniref:Predicted protein n=1 Tax=Naegleria gruberi TaxID=5762 RepID=D2W5P4_NAEGR|nr:uncharacterized protein NAEGRDRAFT_76735 [Naegleria gruberi]EFC35607.1 predicted protein [Naegleria gruberi]|eukprot:XP_002668351.1 predicted protein [Naegleria gruberi strain NEG-M]